MNGEILFPVVIDKDDDSEFGVTVPDLPGCFSAGRTVEEAMSQAKEAIASHLEALAEEGIDVPRPKPVGNREDLADYLGDGGFVALIGVDASWLLGRHKRINITLPERLIPKIDKTAESMGETRSSFLAKSALFYLEQFAAMEPVTVARPPSRGKAARRGRTGKKAAG